MIELWSVLIASGVLSIAFILLSIFTWLNARGQIAGPGTWLLGFSFLALGIILVALRGQISDFISIFIANVIILLGVMLKAMGFLRFLNAGSKAIHALLYFILLTAALLLYIFLELAPSLRARMIVTSVADVIFGIITAYYLFCKAPAELRSYARVAAVFFAIYASIYLYRIINALRWTAGESWLRSGDATEAVIMLAVTTLLAGIAVTEMQLLHGRLRADLKRASEEMAKANRELMEEVRRRTVAETQLLAVNSELSSTQKEIMVTLSEVVEFRSKETARHVARVGEYARVLCAARGKSHDEIQLIADAAPMHDIGKISVSDDILNKPSGLSDQEMTIMREHTLVGYNLLNKSDRPLIKMASLIALEHHEYWNGSGYPKGIAGEAISFAGRVVCLCDVFDALSSLRPYKEAWELPRILDYLRAERGQMFDPELVDALFFHLEEFLAIAKSLKDED
jgi:response regulator RpfG family c-di-GMP phosphodiesterase